MEDVLEACHRPYDPKRPVVCLDETFKQLAGEAREPLPARPEAVERYDYIYTQRDRQPVPSLRANGPARHWVCEPLAGWRRVAVTEQRCRSDWAHFVRNLLKSRCREAERVALVMDQLSTHSLARADSVKVWQDRPGTMGVAWALRRC